MAIIVLDLFYSALIAPTLYQDSAKVAFQYTAATPDELASRDQAPAKPEAVKTIADPTMFLPARDYAGRVAYAIAGAFLIFAALATFLFSSAVIFQFLPHKWFRFLPQNWKPVWKGMSLFGLAVFWSGFSWWIASWFTNVHGRYLVVRDLLNAADSFPGLAPFVIWCRGHPLPTGQLMEMLVFFNTVVALIPIGMLLTALALLTGSQPEPLTPDVLTTRRFVLRCLLWFASASFVMGVLCNKALVEWPLTLVTTDEALALRPIADSLVMQFGALGSAAIFLAFAPAVAVWLTDVHELRTQPHTARGAGDTEAADKLQFAPPAIISSVVAVVAPLLASPVADSLKSVLSAVSK